MLIIDYFIEIEYYNYSAAKFSRNAGGTGNQKKYFTT
jgi:hypothetical protein